MSAFADILTAPPKPEPARRSWTWDRYHCPIGYPYCYSEQGHALHPTIEEFTANPGHYPDHVTRMVGTLGHRALLKAVTNPSFPSTAVRDVFEHAVRDVLYPAENEPLLLALLDVPGITGKALEPLGKLRHPSPEVALGAVLHPRILPHTVAEMAITASLSRDEQVRVAFREGTNLSRACVVVAPMCADRGRNAVLKAARVLIAGCKDAGSWEIASTLMQNWQGSVDEALIAVRLLQR